MNEIILFLRAVYLQTNNDSKKYGDWTSQQFKVLLAFIDSCTVSVLPNKKRYLIWCGAGG